MLIALTQNKELFRLNRTTSRNQLRELRQKNTFYCPACQQRMILKIGEIMTPHFSHHKKTIFCDLFSDHESSAHIRGKHILFDWFQRRKIPVILEPYIPSIRQRPDLLLKQGDTYIAIEFQCSSLPLEKIKKRTTGYTKVNLKVKWIPLAKNPFYLGLQTVSFSSFYQSFIENTELLLLEPFKQEWHRAELILPLYGKKAIYMNEKVQLNQLNGLFERKEQRVEEQQLTTKWLEEKNRYLMNRFRFNYRGMKDEFFKACYENQLAILNLPNWIGLPSQQTNKYHPVEWQLLLVLLLKTVEIDDVYEVFSSKYPKFNLKRASAMSYIRFIKRENPHLLWQNLKNDSISEEIYSQYVALKFDN